MPAILSRRDFLGLALFGGASTGLLVASPLATNNAIAAESTVLSNDEIAYLSTLRASEVAARARVTEDGYWGELTTMSLQMAFVFKATGKIPHQWEPNIIANPGLTSGWQCDTPLAGSALIRHIQQMLHTGETDGIIGSKTISAIQSAVGVEPDGYFSGPSETIRRIQHNLTEYGSPW